MYNVLYDSNTMTFLQLLQPHRALREKVNVAASQILIAILVLECARVGLLINKARQTPMCVS